MEQAKALFVAADESIRHLAGNVRAVPPRSRSRILFGSYDQQRVNRSRERSIPFDRSAKSQPSRLRRFRYV